MVLITLRGLRVLRARYDDSRGCCMSLRFASFKL